MIGFGKHKGKTFEEVLNQDQSYCSWALTVENPSAGLKPFRDFLTSKNFKPKQTTGGSRIRQLLNDSLTCIDLEEEKIGWEKPKCDRRGKKRQSSSDDGWGDDAGWPPEAAEKPKKKSRFSEWLTDDIADSYDDEHWINLSKNRSQSSNQGSSRTSTPETDELGWFGVCADVAKTASQHVSSQHVPSQHVSSQHMASQSVLSHLSPSRTAASPKGAQKGESVCLEIVGSEHFRPQIITKRGTSTFLPTTLWAFFSRHGGVQARSLTGRTDIGGDTGGTSGKDSGLGAGVRNGVLVSAERYSEVIRGLRAEKLVDDLEMVPGFVLRAYPKFVKFAPAVSLQRKAANLLMRVTSPRTKNILKGADAQEKEGAGSTGGVGGGTGAVRDLIGPGLSRELRPFQWDGIMFALTRNGRCLIGDEMGLGKTLQALAIASVYRSEWPALIICPSSLRFQWRDQILHWLPHCFKAKRRQSLDQWVTTQVPQEASGLVVVKDGRTKVDEDTRMVIASYDLVVRNPALQNGFKVIICDESHYLKSITSKRSKVIVPMLQSASRCILLSGTPALNKPSELYLQISSILPDFTSVKEFSERYCLKRWNHWMKKNEYYGSRLEDELNLFLGSTIMIRRLKENVQKELPQKIRTKVPVEISASCKAKIKDAMATLKQDSEVEIEGDSNRSNLTKIFQLTGEAKLDSVCEYLEYIVDVQNKFLIFGHHRAVLDGISDKLKKLNVNYIRIDGSVDQTSREYLVKSYREDPSIRAAVLSITSCGHGLNLTEASCAIFAELYWVPGQILQAEDRCHRMGSKHKLINIYYLLAEESLDQTIWNILQKKWNSLTATLDAGQQPNHLNAF